MSQQGWNAIALSIPIFFVLIGVEILVERRERRTIDAGRRFYRLNDTLNDLACGTIQQLVGVFAKTILFAVYVLLFERLALFAVEPGNPIPPSAVGAGVAFSAVARRRGEFADGADRALLAAGSSEPSQSPESREGLA